MFYVLTCPVNKFDLILIQFKGTAAFKVEELNQLVSDGAWTQGLHQDPV